MKIQTQTITGNAIEIDLTTQEMCIHGKRLGKIASLYKVAREMREEEKARLPKFAKNGTHSIYSRNDDGSGQSVVISQPEAEKINNLAVQYAEEQRAKKRKKLLENIPGLQELEKSIVDEMRYYENIEDMMDDEYNDGVNQPEKPTVNSADVARKYPKAALYLKAKNYCNASHPAKYAAGKEAVEILENGGSMKDAENVLNNWLPASAFEN